MDIEHVSVVGCAYKKNNNFAGETKNTKKTHPKLLHHKRVEEAERYRVRVANGERNKETASVTKIKFQFSIKISILVVILVIISHQIQI